MRPPNTTENLVPDDFADDEWHDKDKKWVENPSNIQNAHTDDELISEPYAATLVPVRDEGRLNDYVTPEEQLRRETEDGHARS